MLIFRISVYAIALEFMYDQVVVLLPPEIIEGTTKGFVDISLGT